jgi:hypothetical protein
MGELPACLYIADRGGSQIRVASSSYSTVLLGYVSKAPIPEHYQIGKVSTCFYTANRHASLVLLQKSRQKERKAYDSVFNVYFTSKIIKIRLRVVIPVSQP